MTSEPPAMGLDPVIEGERGGVLVVGFDRFP